MHYQAVTDFRSSPKNFLPQILRPPVDLRSTLIMAEPKNPWTTKETREVYKNPWIRVTESDVLNPSGNPGIYGVVHFVHTAVGAVPLAEDGTTWLVGQYRYTLDKYSWEIPEGGGKPDEDPLECAKRELLEETGITAANWEPLLTGTQPSNSVSDEVGFVYIARDLTIGEAEPEDCEDLQLKRLPLSEAIDMAMRNEIQDALSVAALLKMRCLGLG